MNHEPCRPLALDLALGAIAGAAATWLMDRVTTVLYEREPEAAKKRENAARGDRTAYEIAAEKAAGLLGRELDQESRKALGSGIHWATGIGAGVVYALLRRRLPAFRRLGSGVAYGTGFWAVVDEAALAGLQLTPPPPAFPLVTHARGLAGHLVLGGAIESAFHAADLVSS